MGAFVPWAALGAFTHPTGRKLLAPSRLPGLYPALALGSPPSRESRGYWGGEMGIGDRQGFAGCRRLNSAAAANGVRGQEATAVPPYPCRPLALHRALRLAACNRRLRGSLYLFLFKHRAAVPGVGRYLVCKLSFLRASCPCTPGTPHPRGALALQPLGIKSGCVVGERKGMEQV